MRATHNRTIVSAAREPRHLVWLLTALAVVLFASAPAQAAFHFMVIQEVFVGPPGDGIARSTPLTPDQRAQYVMLRMTSSGQEFVNGTSIRVENANGTILGTFGSFTANAANGGGACSYPSCPAVIIGTQAAKNLFTFNFDKIVDGQAGRVALPQAGGRVCFVSGTSVVDCVAWGTFNCPGGTCASANGLRTGEFSANGCDTNWGTVAPALQYGKALAHGASFNCAAKTNSTDFTAQFPKPVNNAGNNNNTDTDTDGLVDQLDCADATSTLQWPVTEVQNELVTRTNPTTASISWSSQAAASGSGVVYDVVKGTIANLAGYTNAACFAPGTAATTVADAPMPPAGGGFYYVERAKGCTVGTYGPGVTLTSRDTALAPKCP